MKRTQLRFRSRKMEAVYRTSRRRLVADLLEARPVCERCRFARSQDVHERKSRARGGSITDPDNCVAICRQCHDWLEQHPRQALAEGFSKHSWED